MEFGLFDLAQGIKQETLFVQLGSSGCILQASIILGSLTERITRKTIKHKRQ